MMPNRMLFDHSFQALEKAVGISQQRHGLIANNISNLDTPGFKGRDIDFKSALENAISSDMDNITLFETHGNHMDGPSPGEISVDSFEEEGAFDGLNWVDMDNEMKKLTENKLVYRTAVEAMLRKITIIKNVIKEGGR